MYKPTRNIIQITTFLAMAVTLCLAPLAQAKPNVVIVMTDDQGYGDLSCHGNPALKTPNIDRLHDEAVRLTDFHVSPVCAPTRAALLTGMNPLCAGIWGTTTDRSLMFAGLPTLAEYFADAGYATAMYGKWHLGAVPPYRPQDRGFGESLYWPGGMVGMNVEPWNNDLHNPRLLHNGKEEVFEGYRSDILFDEAINWMRRQHEEGKPFLVYLATLAPHGPLLVNGTKDQWQVPKEYSEPYRELADHNPGLPGFFGMIANVDENMARLEQFLQSSGLAEDTIVIFLTDNGGTAGVGFHNAGMRGGKGSLYDGGHRVPFFIRWPAGGIGGGRDIDELTAHIDLFPTLAELCGLSAPLPETVEGVSLAPLLRGEQQELPQRFLIERSDHKGVAEKPDYRPAKRNSVVMSGKWRLVNGSELYDITDDPGQKTNVATAHPGQVTAMQQALDAFWPSIHPENFDRPRSIRVGSEPVTITSLYGRMEPDTPGTLPVFHFQVRGGKEGFSRWFLDVEESGPYTIELRRWPESVGKPLQSAVPRFNGRYTRLPPGKPLPVHGARITLGMDRVLEKTAAPGAEAIRFHVDLDAGLIPFTARFTDQIGEEITDAYFISISKNNQQGL